MTSLNGSGPVSSLLGPTAFNVFREKRKAHDVEMKAINAALGALDTKKYSAILLEIKDPLIAVSDENEKWFDETGELIENLNERTRAEEADWKVIVEAYSATIVTSGSTSFYIPLPTDVPCRDFYSDENGIDRPLGSATLTDINKNQEESLFFRRMAEALIASSSVAPNGKLKCDKILSRLKESLDDFEFDSILTSDSFAFKQGSTDSGRSSTTLQGLLDCPICKDKVIHKLWIGFLRNDVSLTSLLDFANIRDPKDCENLAVIRQAAAGFKEFLCATFGEHLRYTIGKDVEDVLKNSRLEQITRDNPLFLVRAITRALVSLWNYLREEHKGPDGRPLDLSGDGYQVFWKAELERVMQADALTMYKFSQKMEGVFRAQVRAQVRARMASSAGGDDSSSESDEPAPKKAKGRTSAGADGLCFGALADWVKFKGVQRCTRRGCKFSHDFTSLSQSDVTGAIMTSVLSFLQTGSIKTDFVVATALSGKFK